MNNDLYELDIPLPHSWSDFTSEQLYWMLANQRELLDDYTISECVEILASRIRRRAMDISKSRRFQFGWTMDDARIDIYEFLWHLITHGTMKGHWMDHKSNRFNMYFCKAYRYHIIDIFRQMIRHNPIPVGDRVMGYVDHKTPVIFGVGKIDAEYRDKQLERNRRANERRREKMKLASQTRL